ncbi:MAG: hypothetical protein A2806_04400 [Candidatus Terrybacteria bacterium RIFCSPHIGHO2_01_FULL_48_17]|uniref:PAS domain-containing protein n=1 Tax=Candidatus Terrybacteria bacterium RIFCSPHIGHO2_01_FULL_48_17 TaxID=1802362 RepID=A0A1G2PKR7_9BACT|nr:MAG: hypothetical protein A2806_04400 [Candidatus Terrybacteria bacterium RIFCSPHIGHO2_01_FULL_48_17]OHA52859.1 MAG: hypothetical protein A3A30_03115 [Candidatus Terrybacteria bacterium RIFCSPLOWO2_01_FULL_48_14]
MFYTDLSSLTDLAWNPYALMSFIPALLMFGLAWYLLLWFRQRPGNIFYILLLAFLGIWSFTEGMSRLSGNAEAASFWIKASAIGFCFAIPFYAHFALFYTRREKTASHPLTYLSFYFPALLFYFIAMQTTLIVDPATYELTPWGWAGMPPPFVLFVFTPWLWVLGTLVFFLFLWEFRRHGLSSNEKKVLGAALLATAFPFIAGTITQIVLPAFEIKILPPMVTASLVVLAAILFLQVMRWKMFGITPSLARQSILSAMADGVIITDNSGRIQYVNRAAEKLSDIPEEGLKGNDLSVLFPREGISYERFVSALLAQVKAGKRMNSFEGEFLGKEGTHIPVLISGAGVVLEESGGRETVGMVFVVHDNRKATSVLQELEAKSHELATVEKRLREQLKGAAQA